MRRRRIGIAAVLAISGLLWWYTLPEQTSPGELIGPTMPSEAGNRELAEVARLLRAVQDVELPTPEPDPQVIEALDTEDTLRRYAGDRTLVHVYARVVDQSGTPFLSDNVALWSNCGSQSVVMGGELELQAVVGEECFVTASRTDGWLTGRTLPLSFTVGSEDMTVDVPFYKRRTGGLGVQIRRAESGGILVSRVMDDTPAAEMGLAAGDVILEVDGHSAEDMSVEEFVSRMTGPEGSEVHFVLESSGDTGSIEEAITVERRFLGG